MDTSSPILRAEPAHSIPDTGPRHRGGWFVALLSLFMTLVAVATVSLLARSYPSFAWIPLSLFGVPAGWGWWCVYKAWTDKSKLPQSHSLLAGMLGFDIRCTSCGVAATAFFLPDRPPAGSLVRLLVFLENYTSRQRIARVRILSHPGLGIMEKKTLRLHLNPGQAAVYELPLRVAPELSSGEHSLPVIIQVSRPNGRGVRLPGSRRHLYDIHRFRYAAPFEVAAFPANMPFETQELPAPSYRSLAVPNERHPRFSILQQISEQ